MNLKIKEAIEEYENENYEEVLNILDDVEECGKPCLLIKISCLMNLKRYDESLVVLNSLIEKEPYNISLWFYKTKCHYFTNDDENALKALSEAERLIGENDFDDLITISQLFEWTGDYEKALKYCNRALEIDENSLDAISQKSMVACAMHDDEMMNECANRLLEVCGDDEVSLLLPMTLRLFSGNYRGCLDLVNSYDCFNDDHVQMIKGGLYNKMTEELNIQLALTHPLDLSIDEALDLMFKYHYDGICEGQYRGVNYTILEFD